MFAEVQLVAGGRFRLWEEPCEFAQVYGMHVIQAGRARRESNEYTGTNKPVWASL